MSGRNFNAFIKKQKAEKKKKKKEAKRLKKEARKNEPSSGKLKDMIAYVDKDGNITTERPEEDDNDISINDK